MERKAGRFTVAILLTLTVAFAIVSVYVLVKHPSGFHLPVMAANAACLAAVGMSRVMFSAKSGGAFILLAVPINVLVLAAATEDNINSVGAAATSTLLCTGLIGLILLSRTDKPLSKATKISVTGFLLEMTLIGPVLYLAGFNTVFLLVTLPGFLLMLTAFLTFSAYHWSEITLPSDKWV